MTLANCSIPLLSNKSNKMFLPQKLLGFNREPWGKVSDKEMDREMSVLYCG